MRRVARVLATFVERRWLWLLLAAAVLTAVAVLGATRVEIRTSQDMAISTHSSVYKDYERYEGYFGGDSIIILLAGELDALLSPANLTAAADLQDRLAADRRVKSVISPVTFLEHAARLAQPASPASAPNPEDGRSMLEDSGFVRSVVFAPDGGVNPQLARVIPDDQHVVMVVRLAGGLTVDEQKAVARDVKEMVPQYHFSGARGAGGGHLLCLPPTRFRHAPPLALGNAVHLVRRQPLGRLAAQPVAKVVAEMALVHVRILMGHVERSGQGRWAAFQQRASDGMDAGDV